MQKDRNLDWLAESALKALEQKSRMNSSWVEDTRAELEGLSRLNVLRWIVVGLDAGNLGIVAEHLEVTLEDLAAVRRVLSKI